MNARKRRAMVQLVSTRSPKQARTELLSPDRQNASPTNTQDALRAWADVGNQIIYAGRKTLSAAKNGAKYIFSFIYTISPPNDDDLSQQVAIVVSNSKRLTDMGPPPLPARVAGAVSSASAGSSTSSDQHDSRQGGSSFVYERPYRNRKHIYDKQHKQRVEAVNRHNFKEMKQDLYAYKRRQGYTSSYHDFEGYLRFKAALEGQEEDLMSALAPSPSFQDVRSVPLRSEQPRRHSIASTSDVDTPDVVASVRRALEKIKATRNELQPPSYQIPTYDQLQLKYRLKDEEIDRRLRKPPLPTSLPPAIEREVEETLRRRSGLISKYAREQVMVEDIQRLRPGQWLNDEIINFYGALILGRSESGQENQNPRSKGVPGKNILDVHYFSSFFWSKLTGSGYQAGRLAKWTKKFDIFAKDAVLIPVNHSNFHWTSACINFRRKRIESYDSMGMPRKHVFTHLREYLDAEHRNKKKKPFDFTGWEDCSRMDIPQQENGFDCGVFTCQFLEALSRGEEQFGFTQEDMPYLRRRMVWEILHARLRDEP